MRLAGELRRDCRLKLDEQATVTARDCLQSTAPCDVQAMCAEPYLGKFPSGTASIYMKEAAAKADLDCRLEPDRKAAQNARQCLKEHDGAPCRRVSCSQDYLSQFPQGTFAAEFKEASDRSEGECRLEPDKKAAEMARHCLMQRTGTPCDLVACTQNYLSRFPQGLAATELQAVNDRAEAECRLEPDKNAAELVHQCFERHSSKPCSRAFCAQDYLAQYPQGTSSGMLKEVTAQAENACREQKERERRDSTASVSAQQAAQQTALKADEQAYQLAKDCAMRSDCRNKGRCYDAYLSAYPQGLHGVEAAQAKAEAVCGSARSSAKEAHWWRTEPNRCGGRVKGVQVTVEGNKISWDFAPMDLPLDNHWEGTIDAQGRVEARALSRPGTRAEGLYSNETTKWITMHYPECAAISMHW